MSYEDLRIYKLSLEGVKYVFKITKSASLKSNFSLNDQILRASTSISANIAEGYGRGSKKEFKYFLTKNHQLQERKDASRVLSYLPAQVVVLKRYRVYSFRFSVSQKAQK